MNFGFVRHFRRGGWLHKLHFLPHGWHRRYHHVLSDHAGGEPPRRRIAFNVAPASGQGKLAVDVRSAHVATLGDKVAARLEL